MTNDAARVLKFLRGSHAAGLSPVDVKDVPPDGGKPILRLAARIDELKNLGYTFTTTRRNHCAVYKLAGAPGQESADGSEGVSLSVLIAVADTPGQVRPTLPTVAATTVAAPAPALFDERSPYNPWSDAA